MILNQFIHVDCGINDHVLFGEITAAKYYIYIWNSEFEYFLAEWLSRLNLWEQYGTQILTYINFLSLSNGH